MVDSLRKLVSGNRRRYTEDNVSLDLTYIIPNRLIAMSYPSSGFESLYRNSIDKVSNAKLSVIWMSPFTFRRWQIFWIENITINTT